MATFRGSGSAQNGAAFPTEAELEAAIAAATASEIAAATSAAEALVSENAAQSSEDDAAADLALTNADVVLTHADVVITNADAATTTQDAIDTAADAAQVALDLIDTNQDTIDTAADLVATNQDTIDTAADAAATAADLLLTDLDQQSCAANAVLTAADVVLTAADAVSTAADVVTTTQDAIDTAADVVLTAADVVSTDATWSAFDIVFLGSFASAPTLDNDGGALVAGQLYYNTATVTMYVHTGTVWDAWDFIKFSGGTMTGDLVALSVSFTEATHLAIGSSKTIDWSADGSKQRIELSSSTTLTFTDPPGPTNVMLIVKCGASTSYSVIWPADVDWQGGQAPVFNTGTYDINIVSLYFDGDRYYGSYGYNYY